MQKNNKSIVKSICFNALFASLYLALVFAFGDLSFGFVNGLISFRVAEIIIPLCCFDKRYIPGAILGCFCANLLGGQILDIIIGTLQTCLTVLVLYFVKPKPLSLLLGAFICGIIIGIELNILGFSSIGYWIVLTTFLGEYFILEVGYLIIKKFYYSLKLDKIF